jgi:hypothetical protein
MKEKPMADMRPTIRGIALELEAISVAYIFSGMRAVGIVLAIFLTIRLLAGIGVEIFGKTSSPGTSIDKDEK